VLREFNSPLEFSSSEKCLYTPQFDKDELYQSTIGQFKPWGAKCIKFFRDTHTRFIKRVHFSSSSGKRF
jgi:hypothetical protein